ncbi:hypothetical protein C8Q74DRAFT_1348287 [Fomes fomentarius]|nr:hypothetical protein C8Q74DRAFT_1348287 [Fomes fomentarius]
MEDAANTTIGVTLHQFQERYLPLTEKAKARFVGEFKAERIRSISKAFRLGWKEAQKASTSRAKEKALSELWARIDQRQDLGPLCPGHFLHLSENKYQDGDESKYKIDGSFIQTKDEDQTVPDVPNWALQRLSVEFKRGGTSSDPYDDTYKGSIETEVESRQQVRGQIMSYAKHVFHYQHRTALFFLFVNGDTFRMMRWDRSGVIVAAAKDYMQDMDKTKVLLELLYAFSELPDKGQGFDTTAKRLVPGSCGWTRMDALAHPHRSDIESTQREVPPDDRQVNEFLHPHPDSNASSMFDQHLLHMDPNTKSCDHSAVNPEHISPVFSEIRTLFRDSISSNDFPRYVLTVGDRRFLVGKPIFRASGMVSRGTRGYVALDWGTQHFVFLKDAWRPYYNGLVPEGETLQKLNAKCISMVPTYVCDEDIGNQETETSNYSVTGPHIKERRGPKKDQGSELRHLHHYRLVVKEVCLPSTEFQNAWELTQVIYHAMKAHSEAFTLCGIMHRDVSAGNILILPRVVELSGRRHIMRCGILTDWELSKKVGITQDMQPHRTGTWPFMACRCISDPYAIVGVPDEIESFLYVYLYHAFRFLPTSFPWPISSFVVDFFDGYLNACPPSKSESISQGRLVFHPKKEPVILQYMDADGRTRTHPCNALIEEIFIHLKARYDMLSLLKVQKAEPAPKPEPTDEYLKVLKSRADLDAVSTQIAAAGVAPSGSNAQRTTVGLVPVEIRSRAEKLDSHTWVLSTFKDAIFDTTTMWPLQDKIEDQLAQYAPKEWHSNPTAVTTSMAVTGTSASGKRHRASGSEGSEGTPQAKKAKKGKKAKATQGARGGGSTKAKGMEELAKNLVQGTATATKKVREPAKKPNRGDGAGGEGSYAMRLRPRKN